MHVLITGGTGLVGSELVRQLRAEGTKITVLTRGAPSQEDNIAFCTWTPEAPGAWMDRVDGVDAVVHLAGKGLFDARWSAAYLHACMSSRVRSTELLVQAIARAKNPPKVLVSGSAVGIYGRYRGTDLLDEGALVGSEEDPLVRICLAWEAASAPARELGVRVVTTRLGIVLGTEGGMFAKLAPLFRWGIGGPLGDGTQYVPWLHVADAAAMIRYALATQALTGPCNLSAPTPVTMNELAHSLGRALHRPSLLRVPGFALRTVLGEAAEAMLTGQRTQPAAMLAAGYVFRFAELEAALADLVG